MKLGELYVDLKARAGPLVQELAKMRERVAEFGKQVENRFEAAFGEKWKDRLKELRSQALITFGAAGAAAIGFAQAASPDAVQTLTKSFELLGSEIGKAFVPYVIWAAVKVQELAQWFRELSPTTKKIFAAAVIAAAGLGIILSTVIALTAALRALYTLMLLMKPLFAILGLLGLGPGALAIGALAVGGGLLARLLAGGERSEIAGGRPSGGTSPETLHEQLNPRNPFASHPKATLKNFLDFFRPRTAAYSAEEFYGGGAAAAAAKAAGNQTKLALNLPPPAITGLADLGNQIQLAALQGSDLQATIDANVLQMRQEIPKLLQQGNDHLANIESKVGGLRR